MDSLPEGQTVCLTATQGLYAAKSIGEYRLYLTGQHGCFRNTKNMKIKLSRENVIAALQAIDDEPVDYSSKSDKELIGEFCMSGLFSDHFDSGEQEFGEEDLIGLF